MGPRELSTTVPVDSGDALLPIVGPLWPSIFGLARVWWAGVTG